MNVEGQWDLQLSGRTSVTLCLCESKLSLTVCDHEDGETATAHLDAVGVGQLVALLLVAGQSWCEAAQHALEQAAEIEEGK